MTVGDPNWRWNGSHWLYWNGTAWVPYQPAPYAPAYVSTVATVTDRHSNGAETAIAWILAVFSLGYFLPWAIAATRGRSNSLVIGLLNFLLGWTLIGWIVALVMACGSHQVVSVAAVPAMAPPAWPRPIQPPPQPPAIDQGGGGHPGRRPG